MSVQSRTVHRSGAVATVTFQGTPGWERGSQSQSPPCLASDSASSPRDGEQGCRRGKAAGVEITGELGSATASADPHFHDRIRRHRAPRARTCRGHSLGTCCPFSSSLHTASVTSAGNTKAGASEQQGQRRTRTKPRSVKNSRVFTFGHELFNLTREYPPRPSRKQSAVDALRFPHLNSFPLDHSLPRRPSVSESSASFRPPPQDGVGVAGGNCGGGYRSGQWTLSRLLGLG